MSSNLRGIGKLTSVVAIAMLASCQLVAGVESRNVDPLVGGCTLPQEGTGSIRLLNAFPSDDKVDFCVRASGAAFKRPVLRGGGTACPAGYAYEDVSVPFAVPAGSIDVKAIPEGQTCSAAALSELDGITVADGGPVMTVMRIGGTNVAESIVAFPETTPPDTKTLKLRFINATAGSQPMYFGFAADKQLPTSLGEHLTQAPIAFGAATNAQTINLLGMGGVDPNGYLVLPDATYPVAAANDDANALLESQVDASNSSRTLIAIGDVANSTYPVRGLLCDDAATTTTTLANGESATLNGKCIESSLAVLSVDVYNTQLYGGGAPWEAERRPYIYDMLAKRQSDLQCILEAYKTDQDAIVAAATAAGNFLYSATATADLGTQFTDPNDANGNTPPPSTTPPCGGGVDSTAVNDLYQCLEMSCSTKPGDPSGFLTGPQMSIGSTPSDCITAACLTQVLKLYGSSDPQTQACFDCIAVTSLTGNTYAQSQNECLTDPRPALSFQGQTAAMILSRFPLKNTEVYYFSSTLWRRVAYRTEVQLERGKTVDFYCAQLTSPGNSSTLPYEGNYANGAAQADGYHQEQLLQAQRLVAWIKQKSTTNPVIVAIDTHASTKYPLGVPDSMLTVGESDPDVVTTIRQAFQDAVPTGYVPTCTQCPKTQNAYNGTMTGLAWLDVLTFNPNQVMPNQCATGSQCFPTPTAAIDVNIFANAPMVPLTMVSGSPMGNLSATFGYNVRLLRPQ
jgi:hypothetical protein